MSPLSQAEPAVSFFPLLKLLPVSSRKPFSSFVFVAGSTSSDLLLFGSHPMLLCAQGTPGSALGTNLNQCGGHSYI